MSGVPGVGCISVPSPCSRLHGTPPINGSSHWIVWILIDQDHALPTISQCGFSKIHCGVSVLPVFGSFSGLVTPVWLLLGVSVV